MDQQSAVKAGVMGWPIAHSKSPVVHTYWLSKYNIAGSYERLAVAPDDLSSSLKGLAENGFIGVNLTVPHKERALEFMDEVLDPAQRIGAVNTVFVSKSGKLTGTNTDAYGFMENLRLGAPGYSATSGPAAVLGAGGAARAICVALLDAGVTNIRLINRTRDKAQALEAHLGGKIEVCNWDDKEKAASDATLLVNTTTLGMTGQPSLAFDISSLTENCTVNDIVYAPLETELLANAKARGLKCVDGLGMLLFQAQPGFEKWFGYKPEVTEELRRHVLSAP
jgi:shikimate dehydrogenase